MIKTKTVSFTYQEFDSLDELSTDDRSLIAEARKAAIKAYAPYSKFKVGAAARLDNGITVCGSNVENAAFPSGICAERNVLSTCVSNYPDNRILTLAITSMTENGLCEDPASPCGNCRQVIAEEESRTGSKIRIILSGRNKTMIIDGIGSLLPLQFNKESLKVTLP